MEVLLLILKQLNQKSMNVDLMRLEIFAQVRRLPGSLLSCLLINFWAFNGLI